MPTARSRSARSPGASASATTTARPAKSPKSTRQKPASATSPPAAAQRRKVWRPAPGGSAVATANAHSPRAIATANGFEPPGCAMAAAAMSQATSATRERRLAAHQHEHHHRHDGVGADAHDSPPQQRGAEQVFERAEQERLAGPVGKYEVRIGPFALSHPARREEDLALVVGVELAQQGEAGDGGRAEQKQHSERGPLASKAPPLGQGSGPRQHRGRMLTSGDSSKFGRGHPEGKDARSLAGGLATRAARPPIAYRVLPDVRSQPARE